MRTIKFRGKDIETGEWIYGHFFQRLGHYPAIVEPRPRDGKVMYYEIAVEDNTVGQFTGLLDKNGKEIYEGDIIIEKLRRARKDGERLVICFDGFEWQGKNVYGSTTSLSLLSTYHTIKVIGNIHDNPELLKGGEK